MKGDGVTYYDETEDAPYNAQVIMQVDTGILPENSDDAQGLDTYRQFLDDIEAINPTGSGYTNASVKIDRDKFTINDDIVSYILYIEIESVKPREITVKSDPLYRYQTTVMFNPLTVLRPVDNVTYILALELERRSSNVPNATEEHTNGKYQYQWSTHSLIDWDWQNTDIVFNYTYANTPTWYAAAIVIAGFVGLIVYFACKKRRNNDIIV
jgi:hypothetical protein